MPDLTLAEPLDFDFEKARIAPAPAEMQELVRQLANQTCFDGPEKRGHSRYRMALEVPVVELDVDLRPTGAAFVAMSRDISATGICLVHTHRVAADQLLIKLDNRKGMRVQAVVQITRRRQLKQFFEMSGNFVLRCND
jgi:hypothetical protein